MASLNKLYDGALADYRAAARPGLTPESAAMVLVANTLLNTDLALNR